MSVVIYLLLQKSVYIITLCLVALWQLFSK